MQLLQYITCIWYNWTKAEKERLGGKENVNKRASFRYPPILPIVYYEGAKSWKEAPELKDRILLQEDFELIRDIPTEQMEGILAQSSNSVLDVIALYEHMAKKQG